MDIRFVTLVTIYICICIRIYIYICICMCMSMSMWMCMCMYVYMYIHIHLRIRIRIHIHIHIFYDSCTCNFWICFLLLSNVTLGNLSSCDTGPDLVILVSKRPGSKTINLGVWHLPIPSKNNLHIWPHAALPGGGLSYKSHLLESWFVQGIDCE